jgi:hypothetical protein
MKPIAWYDPSNGMVSTDRDCPLFTPLGQVWALYSEREWVGLTDEERDGKRVLENGLLFNTAEAQVWEIAVEWAEQKLKEKNG